MTRDRPRTRRHACILLLLAAGIAHAQNRAEIVETATIEVVGTMPLPGLGVPRLQVPSNVSAMNSADARRSGAATLPELIESGLPGIFVDQAQGNAQQADVAYRGFIASPRLGLAQGLSVFLDGARVNEPFGDVVHWDLIPQNAIATVTLIPGSNPLFGLNTLGGALSIRTKSGEHFPGSEITLGAGSFGRIEAAFEHGASTEGRAAYFAGSAQREDGWRDHSPSDVKQLFVKLGRQASEHDLDVSLLLADTRLIGNQLAPQSFLRERWQTIYTFPDVATHRLAMINANASRWLTAERLLALRASLRRLELGESNADVNSIDDPRFGVVPFEGGPNDGPAGANVDSASINRIRSTQSALGLDVQHTWLREDDSQITVGGALDHSLSSLRQSYELGSFNADRSASGTGVETESVDITGRSSTASVFVSALLKLDDATSLTASARYNRTRVRTTEHSLPQPPPALGLNNDFTYRSLNPALGITRQLAGGLNLYAGVNQGNRTPSPIELGCADRNSPCVLSNAMGSDPFLKQVIARSIEAGMRGRSADTEWQLGAFRTDLRDDILFVSAGGAQSMGYFTNFGATRRQGLEAAVARRSEQGWSWSARYSLVVASFQSDAVVVAENNSSRDTDPALADDEIRVRPGDIMPGVPRHQLHLSAHWSSGGPTPWTLGAALRAHSAVYVRGNENNAHQAGTVVGLTDTRTYTGSGLAPGYAVVDLTGSLRLDRRWELSGRISNLFDRRYSTGGALAENAFPGGRFVTDSDAWLRETFYSPGAPRSVWLGLRLALD